MQRTLAVLSLVASLSPATLFAQGGPTLEGAWKLVERTDSGTPANNSKAPLESLFIFTKRHFSVMAVEGDTPRRPVQVKDPNHLTDAEKLGQHENWRRVQANTGTYTFDGTTLNRSQVVARGVITNPKMAPMAVTFEGKDVVWLVTKLQPSGERRTKYVRLE